MQVVKADDKNYVLVWSFNDTLAPKLLLECPREVTTVAANPLDGNRIVGGCENGQLSKNLLLLINTVTDEYGSVKITGGTLAYPRQNRTSRNGHCDHRCSNEV